MRFELPHPVSTNKLWRHIVRGNRAVRIDSAEAAAWKQEAGLVARAAMTGKPLDGRFKAHLIVYGKTGTGAALDLDNCAKAALDVLQGIAYTNDRNCEVLVIERGERRPGGGLTVEIESLE